MKKKSMKSKAPVTTAENLESRFSAGESVLDYFDARKAQHPNWGGARRGAGRKSNGNVRLQLSVPPGIRSKIQRLARDKGVSVSQVVSSRF
jgi:hypothetical protein